MTTRPTIDPWQLTYDAWDPAAEPVREALTVLANGRVSTRGAAEECPAGGPHYPGTYLADGYNRVASEVNGRTITNECLVNWPNWLPLSFRVGDDDWFAVDDVELLAYRQALELKRGLLVRTIHFRDQAGREFKLQSRRLVHMGRPAVAALQWQLTPLNWSGALELRTAIDGRVANTGVERYQDLTSEHLTDITTGQAAADTVTMTATASQSRLRVAQAVRTRVVPDDVQRETVLTDRVAAQHLTVACEAGQPIVVEKVLAMSTGRDHAISEPLEEACKQADRLPDFATLLAEHERAWRHLWRRADLEFDDCDARSQLILRVHIFHLLQVATSHAADADVSIPARGLHGEA
jgi:trehalose/maltose hydrolase-like predicted phosphorylase